MNRAQLISSIQKKKSFLCVGLDTDKKKLPAQFKKDFLGIINFNKKIIDATKDYCVAYKLNTAFYEAFGKDGWMAMQQTVEYIGKSHFIIADAKRGDIGNTSEQYANAFLKNMNFDAITVSPYMGSDSVKPFLQLKNKWTIVLGLTSNEGAKDFEMLSCEGKPLYQHVIKKISEWGTDKNLMFVVGATRADEFKIIRKIIPSHFLLIPGVGTQGGSLDDVAKYALNKDCGVLVNVSRAIIYASKGKNFADAAREQAKKYQQQMSNYF